MNEAVLEAWYEFLGEKDIWEWLEEFDESLVGRGPEYALSEDDIDELSERIERIEGVMTE